MKKSFKKAGAAIISMSMLLAMGAVSMPVYAAQTQPWPGQVEVVVDNTNKWADDANAKFEYLGKLQDATVRIYRVAKVGVNGWEWEEPFKTAVEGSGIALEEFNDLIAKTGNTFDATAAQRKELASLLERAIRNDTTGAFRTPAAQGTTNTSTSYNYISEGTFDGDGTAHVLLPQDNQLSTTTEDEVGYYLISTMTNDAGVVIQPSLISLKNSKATDPATAQNPIRVSLKGNNISIDKSITSVVDEDTEKQLQASPITVDNNTATASQYDKVSFRIDTQLPKYDVNLESTDLAEISITDTPDVGIIVVDDMTAAAPNVNDLKVYASTDKDDLDDLSADTYLLQKGKDYTVVTTQGSSQFKIVFTPGAMLYGSGVAQADMRGDDTSVAPAPKVSSQATGNEGKFVAVTFTGKVTDDLKKKVATTQAWSAATMPVDTDSEMVTADTLKLQNKTKFDEYLAAADALNIAGANAAYTGTDVAKVAMYLRYMKANALGGENTSTLSYGNEYATGKNTTKTDDKVKLFAVDLDLMKISDQFLIEEISGAASQTYQQESGEDATKRKLTGAILELFKTNEKQAGDEESYGLAITDNGKLYLLREKLGTDSADDVVYNDGTKDWVKTTDIAWTTLGAGKYTLKEVKAPTGYTPIPNLSFEIKCDTDPTSATYGEFSVAQTDMSVPAASGKTVQDVTGSTTGMTWDKTKGTLAAELKDPIADTLPATGGIGTVLFTAGGIAVVLAAGALFVMYMKKRETEE